MIGAIIGDIIGSRFEFGPKPEKNFTLFTDECSYTDDTICTVAVADAILKGKDYKSSLLEWCRRYPSPMGGYGARFIKWMTEDDPQPNGSFGNGSAMRVSAVGWLFDEFRDVVDEAEKTAAVSHNHAEGIKGAQCIATLIYWLRTCRITKDEVENAVRRKFGYKIPPLNDVYKIGAEGHFDATCQETVPAAIRCFIDSTDFENTIRLAVMADGDTDTKAAIAGSVAEAFYDIPGEMTEKAMSYLPNDMLDVIERFLDRMRNDITE